MSQFLLAGCSSLLVSSLVSSHELYEFEPWRKVSYKGLGNQFWDKAAGSSIYRVAEAFEVSNNDDDLAKPILAPFAHALHRAESGTPWSMLFDLSSIHVVANMDGLTYLSTNCSRAKSALERHQILSGTCKEATQQEACQLLRSHTIAWVDNDMLPCRKRRQQVVRSHDHAFSSPFFFDPVKRRQDSFDSESEEDLPFKHESAILNPALGMALRNLGFSNLIRNVTKDILEAVGCSLENIGAVHVRRGDRNNTLWRQYFSKRFGLFNESCQDCRSCVHRCTPTNEDLMFLGDNFTSPFVTVVWVASDDASIDSMLLHDAPTPSSSNSLVMVSQSSRFIEAIIESHLRKYTNSTDLALIRAAIDLYFLSYSNQVILDLYSTFSAIAMRKREATEKYFMVW